MNIEALVEHGHKIFLRSFESLPDSEWDTAGACGKWSARDVIGHVTIMEHVLDEVLLGFAGGGDTPYLTRIGAIGMDAFLVEQLTENQLLPLQAILTEYQLTYDHIRVLLPQIPAESWSKPGTLPWYGDIYALDDFLVYSNYAHKREHSAQLALFSEKSEVRNQKSEETGDADAKEI